jgi:REP element-mobilizing transposase RayT
LGIVGAGYKPAHTAPTSPWGIVGAGFKPAHSAPTSPLGTVGAGFKPAHSAPTSPLSIVGAGFKPALASTPQMKYNPSIHHRHSIRLKEYDYSHKGLYFITICVQSMECLLGKISEGEMVLNEYGKIIQTVWNELPQHYANIQLEEFVIMPNHIHGIIVITDKESADGAGVVRAGLPEIVRALKTFSARQINKMRGSVGKRVWQRNYYEHIIRNPEAYRKIAIYILNNPANWLNDKFYNACPP